ncbi:pyrroloquinoline quinone biosynthesis peptide chaperone PqqD [Phenylobacterium deserti]|uniref:PqqA binding protein n=1 Tax=Phenylobacterium deserti TaxID=1914756 RepID=A0A328A8P8_9CAUL|nr:pyrroloquinoline quinone biosynthesis peptide chaperone PqqD [Phenylobacterium deserti]RAK50940.1 pyrroloquinoline quinone biosynthesis peptide chaperone PqqD [Phenylobacterium deserti]
MITAQSQPALSRGVKLRFDQAREAWVLLAPERMFALDQPSTEILKLVDGERTVEAISDDLAARFNAPRDVILADVVTFLEDLRQKGAVRS